MTLGELCPTLVFINDAKHLKDKELTEQQVSDLKEIRDNAEQFAQKIRELFEVEYDLYK